MPLNAIEVAKQAAREGGLIVYNKFKREDFWVKSKSASGDLLTEADGLSERHIVELLKNHFPDHQIWGEEQGSVGSKNHSHKWIIDPLDGTNNFAVGLPVFGTCVSLLVDNKISLGAIYLPATDQLLWNQTGQPTYCNGRELIMPEPKSNPKQMTIAYIKGHEVSNPEQSLKLCNYLSQNCKRVFHFWAPTIAWSLLALGKIDGIVLYDSEGEDLYSGMSVAKGAGCEIIDFDGNEFFEVNEHPYLVAGHKSRSQAILQLVNEASH